MRVLISGSGGFIGSHLVRHLRQSEGGYDVRRLVRRAAEADDEIPWDPDAERMDPATVSGMDVVIHLAGATLTTFTRHKERRLTESKVEPTRALCTALAQAPEPPEAILIASGLGYAGDCGDDPIDDDCPVGTGFVAELYRDVEAAAAVAQAAGIRVVFLRLGAILGTDGGPFASTARLVRRFFGGPIGRGRMWVSWLTIDDAVRAIEFVAQRQDISAGVNIVSPNPLRQREYIRAIGKALHRPTVVRLSTIVTKWLFGGLADVVLSSYRAVPRKLVDAGFEFRHPELAGALEHLLTPPPDEGP